MSALRRIMKELVECQKDPPAYCTAGLVNENDLYFWQGWIIGPKGSLFEGGVFYLKINFPTEYPFIVIVYCVFSLKFIVGILFLYFRYPLSALNT